MLGPILAGRNGVALAPMTLDDYRRYIGWAAQPEVSYFWGPRQGEWVPERIEDGFRRRAEDPDAIHWTIRLDDAPVGYAGIEHIDWIARQGESYIFIGEHRVYGRGIASEAVRLRTDFGFRDMNLHRLYNWAAYENVGSRRANVRVGYRQRVRIPKVMRRGRRRLDVWAGEILRSDWEARGGQEGR